MYGTGRRGAREAGNFEVVAEADGRVTRLVSEEGRLYAVTPGRLLLLDPEYLKTLETVDIDGSLEREALERAGFSGLAVGEDNLYPTLHGEPYVVRAEKP